MTNFPDASVSRCPSAFDAEIRFAQEAVRQAALLARCIQSEMVINRLATTTKDDLSPVTVADFAIQALVGRLLSEAFPAEMLVAEEDSELIRKAENAATLEAITYYVKEFLSEATPQMVCNWIDHNRADTAQRFWTLDPIDGTKGFLRGDQYAIALALVVDGIVQVGALGCPNLIDGYRPDLEGTGSLVVAARGQGAWVTDLANPGPYDQLQVSTRGLAAEGRLLRSFESGHTNVDQIDLFSQTMGIQAAPVRMDSQAKYAVLAAGKGDLLLRFLSPSQPGYREKIWDQAAGSIVLEEAGGRITDLDGQPFDFTTGRTLSNNRGVLASNNLLHMEALAAIKKIAA